MPTSRFPLMTLSEVDATYWQPVARLLLAASLVGLGGDGPVWALDGSFVPAAATGAIVPPVNQPGGHFNFRRLPNSQYVKANLAGAHFFRAMLMRSDMTGATLTQADLRSARLQGCKMNHANLGEARLSNANLTAADLSEATLTHASLIGANLRKVRFNNANLSYANLTGAHLEGADFQTADLSNATFALARYSVSTHFPKGFQPLRHGMINSSKDRFARGARVPQQPIY